MTIEHRTARSGGVRAGTTDDGQHVITLTPITPYTVDDYGSVWMPDVFDASLDERMPTLAWAHRWDEPVGRAIDWKKDGDLREITFRLDDFDAVPLAKRLYTQVKSGTIDDCSVGFSGTTRRAPTDDELEKWPGAVEIIERAGLDEVSGVLRGAVPGAKMRVRSAGGRVATVDEDLVLDVAEKVAAGDMTEAAARALLRLMADDDGTPPALPANDPPEDSNVDEAMAEADAALDQLTDRSR